jgi:hypothetical protein
MGLHRPLNKSENGLIQTSVYIRGGIRCHGGGSIPCSLVAPVVSPTIKLLFTQTSRNRNDFFVYRLISLREIIDWLIISGFTSRSRIFHLYGNVTNAGEGLQNLGLCSAIRAFEQGGIFIVPHLLRNGTSCFPVSSEGPRYSVASNDTRGDVEDLF